MYFSILKLYYKIFHSRILQKINQFLDKDVNINEICKYSRTIKKHNKTVWKYIVYLSRLRILGYRSQQEENLIGYDLSQKRHLGGTRYLTK